MRLWKGGVPRGVNEMKSLRWYAKRKEDGCRGLGGIDTILAICHEVESDD
jgi:hypothetical protein